MLARLRESDDHPDVDPPPSEREWSHPSSWAGLVGLWTFDGRFATYRGPQDPDAAYGISMGIKTQLQKSATGVIGNCSMT